MGEEDEEEGEGNTREYIKLYVSLIGTNCRGSGNGWWGFDTSGGGRGVSKC